MKFKLTIFIIFCIIFSISTLYSLDYIKNKDVSPLLLRSTSKITQNITRFLVENNNDVYKKIYSPEISLNFFPEKSDDFLLEKKATELRDKLSLNQTFADLADTDVALTCLEIGEINMSLYFKDRKSTFTNEIEFFKTKGLFRRALFISEKLQKTNPVLCATVKYRSGKFNFDFINPIYSGLFFAETLKNNADLWESHKNMRSILLTTLARLNRYHGKVRESKKYSKQALISWSEVRSILPNESEHIVFVIENLIQLSNTRAQIREFMKEFELNSEVLILLSKTTSNGTLKILKLLKEFYKVAEQSKTVNHIDKLIKKINNLR